METNNTTPYINVTLTHAQAEALGYILGAARREIGTPASSHDKSLLARISQLRDLLEDSPYHNDFLDKVEVYLVGLPRPSEYGFREFLKTDPEFLRSGVASFLTAYGHTRTEAPGLCRAILDRILTNA